MKLIAGSCRGMPLLCPKGQNTRPTAAKIREAVMSMLAADLDEARFLDLFAGSGAMGLEAVSRGAKACVFVESERAALQALQANLKEAQRRLSVQGLAVQPLQVLACEVSKAATRLKGRYQADIIWADPPYADAKSWLEPFLAGAALELAAPEALLLVELPTDVALSFTAALQNWEKIKERPYGGTTILIWRRL